MSHDAELARTDELLELLDFGAWHLVSQSLSHSTPHLRDDRYDGLGVAQAWLASHAHATHTPIGAALANVRRILDDLLLAFNYELDPRQHSLWMRKWYHPGLGGSGEPSEAERFELNVLLVRNLTAELARALNLLLQRARELDPNFRASDGLATIDTGASNAPFQAAQYSAAEASRLEPYPGLCGFPAVISSRAVGALGAGPAGVPRKPSDFEAWIDDLVVRTGGVPSPPPPDPTAVVPSGWADRPALGSDSAPVGDHGTDQRLPSGWIVVVIGLLVDAASVALAPSWVAGAIVGGTAGTLLAWVLRRPHKPLLRLGSLLVAGLTFGCVVGVVLSRSATSLEEQVRLQLSEARDDDRFVVQRRSASLHDGRHSVLLILRDVLLKSRIGVEVPSRRSDELRIVDEGANDDEDARLSLRYAFQNPGQIEQQPEGDSPGMLLNVKSIADVDADGRREALLAVERNSLATGPLVVPLLVLWDDEDRRYRVHPLTPQSPLSRERSNARRPDLLVAFRRPTVLEDQFSGETLRPYPVDEFALEGASQGPLFMAAVNLPTSVGASDIHMVFGSHVTFNAGDLGVQPCERSARVTAIGPAALRERMRRALEAPNGPCS